MKRFVMASFAVALVSLLAFGNTGSGKKERKPRMMSADFNLEPAYAIPQTFSGLSTLKAGAATAAGTVLDSTDYDYGMNWGVKKTLEWTVTGIHAIYHHRDLLQTTPANRRSVNYTYYNGSVWSSPAEVQAKATAASGWGSIDVFKSGAGTDVAVVAGHVPIWVGIDGGAGAGTFSPANVAGRTGTDPDVLIDNNETDLWLLDMGSRTTITISHSTDFGGSWTVKDSNLIKYATGGQGRGTLDNVITQAPNGTLAVPTVLWGDGWIPPLGSAHPDSADQLGYFQSTDNGSTWTWNSWGGNGELMVVGSDSLYIVPTNWAMLHGEYDSNNDLHIVAHGHMVKMINDTTFENFFGTLYRKSGQSGWSLISRTQDMRSPDYDTYLWSGNAYGFPYPSISVDRTTGAVFAVWSQPRLTAGGAVDTVAGGFPIYEVWYNSSADGSAWGTAQSVAGTENGLFTYAARHLVSMGGDNYRAHVLYLEDIVPGNAVFEESAAAQVPWRYVAIDFTTTPTGVDDLREVPTGFTLEQNYPNPFNPATTIRYNLGKADFVTLKVYNLLGQEVATLVNGMQQAGPQTITFEASNLASGMYLYKITAGSFSEAKKMLLTK